MPYAYIVAAPHYITSLSRTIYVPIWISRSSPRITMPLELLHMTNASAFYCFMGTMLRARGLTEVNAELIGILIETMHLFVRAS